MASLSMSLHAVNYRLTNIPVKQLPPIASCLATSLSNCGELLSSQHQKSSKSDSEDAVQVHKLMTRLTSLLQDRTPEGRWTAVVLVKAIVEAGQWEVLRGCEPFVRGLMAILAKPDPTSTKKMSIITLTRIFHLTYQYPTLVREITTPSLPGFITSALNLISVKPSSEPIRTLKLNATPFLETVLYAFGELIARHPTIFRPFSAQIHSLLQAIIGSTSPTFSKPVVELAGRLFVLLHNCAPKNTSGEEWKTGCQMTIASLHGTAHYVLRAVVEQWESSDPSLQKFAKPQDYSQEMRDSGPDPLGLPSWQGIASGVDRLIVVLRMLSSFLRTPTASTVVVPVGLILDLTSRLTSVMVPSDGIDVQYNPQIGRAERESLFAELPRIHTACLEVLFNLVETLESGSVPVAQTILEQALWVFRAEGSSREVRTSIYDLIHALITYIGPSLTKQAVLSLTKLLQTACHDLFPQPGDDSASVKRSSDSKGKSKPNQATTNADAFLNPGLKQSRHLEASSSLSGLKQAASELISVMLTHAPTEFLAPSLRAEIDRTIIMTSDKNAMLASVLNPLPPKKGRGAGASIIPFLTRSYAAELEVEGLIRPRMPVLMNASPGFAAYDNIDEDEEDEAAVSVAHTTPANTGFLKPSTTPILQANLMDTDLSPQPVSASSKRSHQEALHKPPLAPSGSNQAEGASLQSKRQRVETSDIATPSQPSLKQASPGAFTGTAALSIPTSSVPSTEAPRARTASVNTPSTDNVGGLLSDTLIPQSTVSSTEIGAAAQEAGENESDDEIPALNLDPDTDDEDEDEEDVAMGES
ncbi:hypothetical protein EYZ11_003249 [Aspergillus tanneri]|uniref:Pre-rRNA-processing protein RIX1 n=1 Tax=Aspergillus tanneri TaxID=1220188 RepID=A0A4S3JTQ5_9EURO|nr:uncharacterized protein ATNIH1004_006307 [Aspergillus tanneri]KAA8647613.1 hypothetical protein ATNIH1004_006307 [Aspergillus tanneri]THC97301.1 hypothetical protein EYZ11_003249 [Aspergillus tanneri]